MTRHGLVRTATVPSGGIAPVSVAEDHGRVYVLNSGDTPSRGAANVTELASVFGHLVKVRGGSQDLAAGAAGTAQVSVTPDGRRLVVTERESNRIETLRLDGFGRPGEPVVNASSGTVPFGFAFGRRGELIVSEAGLSTVSSYRAGFGGGLAAITPSLTVGQGAACWVAVFARRALRIHRQRVREHQRLRDRPRRVAHRARRGRHHRRRPRAVHPA